MWSEDFAFPQNNRVATPALERILCTTVLSSLGLKKRPKQRESERGGSLELQSWIDTERETQEKVQRKSERTKDLEGRDFVLSHLPCISGGSYGE